MTEAEALQRMIPPGQHRPGKWRGGVIQIHVTRACNLACYSCTQGSNLGGKTEFMPPELFEQALLSLRGYFGVVGTFGGNPAMSPHFPAYCELLRKHVPFEQRGLWCNDLRTEENGRAARATFNPAVSNLNVHMDRGAWERFRAWWPEAMPFGLDKDSRHSPCFAAMREMESLPAENVSVLVIEGGTWIDPKTGLLAMKNTEANRHLLISRCDINQHWSASIGMFRGELRAWFCEIAMAQSILHQYEKYSCENPGDCSRIDGHEDPDNTGGCIHCQAEIGAYSYPDTGLLVEYDGPEGLKRRPDPVAWWRLPMTEFADQVRHHCHACSVPLRGHGQLAVGPETQAEQTSVAHASIYKPKRRGRPVEVVTELVQLELGRVQRTTDYLGNANR